MQGTQQRHNGIKQGRNVHLRIGGRGPDVLGGSKPDNAYIKIAVLRGRNAMECHSELVEALGNNALPYGTVAQWVEKFQQGRVSTTDEQRCAANADANGIQRLPHRCGGRSRGLH
ncbi:HTH_48 domain-containing protein [Trichonephila clavipes]|nr:HTH_48 domain-containing protein [Trichonephila clavipes]